MTTTTDAKLTAEGDRLRREADAKMAQYPQYAGAFDGFVPVVCKRDVKSRGAVIVRKGEVTLVDPTSGRVPHPESSVFTRGQEWLVGKVFATFWCPNNLGGCKTSLRVDYFDMGDIDLTITPDGVW